MAKRRLRTAQDCRRLLAHAINELLDGNIPESQAKTLTYMLHTLTGIIAIADIEPRLKSVEEFQNEQGSAI